MVFGWALGHSPMRMRAPNNRQEASVNQSREPGRPRKGRVFVTAMGAASAAAILSLPFDTVGLQAQTQSTEARPVFEAASVKRNRTGGQTANSILPGGRYSATNVPLRMMIRSAYRVQDLQLVGGPDWMDAEGYDVTAKADGNPPPDQLFAMVRHLLEDRFKLVARREVRDIPVYALMRVNPDGLGPQLRRSANECTAPSSVAPRQGAPPRCGLLLDFGEVRGTGAALTQLATGLSPFVGRIIQDRTNLTGLFDFELHFTPDAIPAAVRGAPNPPSVDPDRPSVFTALREQLGLRLESTNGPVEVLVVDRIERPNED